MMIKILFAAVLASVLPPALFAHGVEVSRVSGATAFVPETVRFGYSTGEAMSFAIIRMYAPSKPEVETVQSITDRNGYFSFVPDEAGEWRITAEDGMGHKGALTVQVVQAADGSAPPNTGAADGGTKTPLPLTLRILLGLSLILNIFAVYRFVLNKSAPRKEAPHHAH
ncbi:MAG: hypothetical protein LBT01_07030 [Spirochaetaceae bacterium]|nr:hypothetical protein [Spirochaetaceae bacterium]